MEGTEYQNGKIRTDEQQYFGYRNDLSLMNTIQITPARIKTNSPFALVPNSTSRWIFDKRRLPSHRYPLSMLACLAVVLWTQSPARAQDQTLVQTSRPAVSIPPNPTSEERAADKQNMLTVYKALKAFEKEHGKLPDWLSDLVPKYLSDSNVLVSPYFRRTGKAELYGNEDPHLTTSYIYEFSAKPVPQVIRTAFPDLPAGMTMREWKTRQIGEFGPVVPILRCFIHNPVLNVSSDGEFFESGGYWETDPKTLELRKQRLATGGKSEGKRPGP